MNLSALALVLAAATAAPAPSPTPPNDLREIGRVRAVSPFCKAVVAQSGDAVGAAFDADSRISLLISSLSRVDLDSSVFANQNGLREMEQRYTTLRDATAKGDQIVKELRKQIAASTDPQERAALFAFANALGGAIGRQVQFLKDYGRVLSYAEELHPSRNPMYVPIADPFNVKEQNALTSPGAVSSYVRGQMQLMQQRLPAIDADEREAGARAIPAFSRCDSALPGDESPAPAPR
jgi:hypothetical protein